MLDNQLIDRIIKTMDKLYFRKDLSLYPNIEMWSYPDFQKDFLELRSELISLKRNGESK